MSAVDINSQGDWGIHLFDDTKPKQCYSNNQVQITVSHHVPDYTGLFLGVVFQQDTTPEESAQHFTSLSALRP